MAIDVNFVLKIAPEFTNLSPSIIQFFIDQTKPFINFPWWGDKADMGHAFYVAHLLKMTIKNNGLPGPVTSEKVGDLATSYGMVNNLKNSLLTTTGYGIIFLSMRDTLELTPLTILDAVMVIV